MLRPIMPLLLTLKEEIPNPSEFIHGRYRPALCSLLFLLLAKIHYLVLQEHGEQFNYMFSAGVLLQPRWREEEENEEEDRCIVCIFFVSPLTLGRDGIGNWYINTI